MSERRACTGIGTDRTSIRYGSCRAGNKDLRARLRDLADSVAGSAIGRYLYMSDNVLYQIGPLRTAGDKWGSFSGRDPSSEGPKDYRAGCVTSSVGSESGRTWIALRKGRSPIASFPLMPDGQNDDLVPLDTVQSDVAAMGEIDQLFPISGLHVLNGAADPRLLCQDLNAGADRRDRALGSVGVFEGEEVVEALNVGQGMRRPDQSWHLGISASSPASSLASQASASSIVRCSPVS